MEEEEQEEGVKEKKREKEKRGEYFRGGGLKFPICQVFDKKIFFINFLK